jgi:GAF domain-containing protein
MKPAPSPVLPPIPAGESARLEALRRYRILDSGAEVSFDDVAALAAAVTGTPVALVSLIDEGRAWFKARVGLDVPEAPRDIAFCSWAVATPEHPLEVPDLREDARFAGNPLVLPDDGFRAYTGVPLVTGDGHALGTLCVLDHEPRRLTSTQLEALRRLARTVMSHIEARRVAHTLLSVTQVLDEVRGLHQLTTVDGLAAAVGALLVRVTDGDTAGLLLATPDGGWRAADGRELLCGPAADALPALRRGEHVFDRLVGMRAPGVGPASALHLPLVRDGRLHGLLGVQWDRPVTATDDTLVQVLDVVAHEVGYALTELQARAAAGRGRHRCVDRRGEPAARQRTAARMAARRPRAR